jgi:hypothetical protein
MRVRDGKNLSKVYKSDFPTYIHNPNISSHEVFLLKNLCSGHLGNPTEPIIVQLLSNYLSLNKLGERDGIRLFWGPFYKGIAGNNQEIDVSIEYNGKIIFGISIKSKFGGGYLEKADLDLSLIKEHRNTIKRFEERGSVSDVLQDMARIQNIKDKLGEFESVTILYSKPCKKKWTEKFSKRFSHQYIFLEGNQRSFFEELEEKLPGLRSFKSNFPEESGTTSILKDDFVKGKAIKGSRFLLQNYVNNKQEELNNQILMSSPSLLSFLDKEMSFLWKSPLKENGYQEYRNEFLEFVDEWKDKRIQLKKYWANKGPQWDGVAIVEGKNRQKGLVLVEAKAHLHEMASKIKAKDPSKTLIETTIKEVKRAMGSQASLDIWLNHYYQLSNRLAFLYVLNEKIGIPTWLILANFVNDRTHIPTGTNEWIHHYREVFTQMDISSSFSSLFNQIVTIYPKED